MALGVSNIKGFKQINVDDLNLNMIQDNVQQVFDDISKNPLLDGHLIEDIFIGGQDTEIRHNLGRSYRGWILTKINTKTTVYETAQSDSGKKVKLILSCPDDVTISIWVF